MNNAAHQRGRLRAAAVVVTVATLLAVSACNQSKPSGTDPLGHAANEIRLYGTDGNMANSVAGLLKDSPDGLVGMKGTAPLPPLSQSFKDRLRGVDRSLSDYLYAGEAYDAVVISALAAQLAKSTDPTAIAAQITGVTTGGTPCDEPVDCLGLARQGKNIAYRGISLRLGGLTDSGEPSAVTYGILRFAAHNRLDDTQTEFVQAGDPKSASTNAAPGAAQQSTETPLRVGGLLPHSGALKSVSPPMFAGVRLAVREVNAAGGVLGKAVEYVDGDDGTDPAVAKATVQQLVSQGVQVIIGAGASGITKAILPDVVAAGVVLFSPCNTAESLSTADDNGLYFRTAPPDNLQANALSDIIMRDGTRKLVIVARDDAYGKGLMDSVKQNLLKAGLTEADIKTIPYNIDKPDFSGLGDEVKAFSPDGVLVVGYDESAEAYASLIKAGLKSRAT